MERLQWKDDLAIGITQIDEQHRTWINHFNNIVEAAEFRSDSHSLTETLDFLIEYTQFHFDAEQNFMSRAEYPDFEAHRKLHEELKSTLNNLVEEFEEEGATHILAESVNTFLGNWLINHIQNVDSKFGAYISENNIQLTD